MDGKDSLQVPAPKMLPDRGDGRPRPPTAINRGDLTVQDFSDSDLGEEEVGEAPIDEVEEWKDDKCSRRPAIWQNLIIDKDWEKLRELIDFSSEKHPQKKFYPIFKVSEIKAAFEGRGDEDQANLEDEQFNEVRDECGNTSLHMAILGVAEEEHQEKKQQAKDVLRALCNGAYLCRNNDYAPFIQKNKNGDNALHLAVKKLDDFSLVKDFFHEINIRALPVDKKYYLFLKDGDNKDIFDIVGEREECDFKKGFKQIFSEYFSQKKGNSVRSASAEPASQQSTICTIS